MILYDGGILGDDASINPVCFGQLFDCTGIASHGQGFGNTHGQAFTVSRLRQFKLIAAGGFHDQAFYLIVGQSLQDECDPFQGIFLLPLQLFFMDVDIQRVFAYIDTNIDDCFALFKICLKDSILLNSSSKLIRLFEIKIGSVQYPRLLTVSKTNRSSEY